MTAKHPVIARGQVRVLIGERQTALIDLFSACVEAAVAAKYQVRIMSSSPGADEILQLGRSMRFDLAILILNNIVFPDILIGTRQSRSSRWLRFITEVKGLCQCPIIVFCGWMTDDAVLDTLHVTDAIAAGASFFFRIPPAVPEIVAAMERCFSDGGLRAPPNRS